MDGGGSTGRASSTGWSSATSDVRLKRESDAECSFANQRAGAAAVAIVGFAVLRLMYQSGKQTPAFLYALVALFPLLGLIGLWWRDELRLDLALRQYTRRRGFWPSIRVTRGSLDDLEAVVLTRDLYRSTDKGGVTDYPVWRVMLDFRGWDRGISVLVTRDELQAHQRFEHFAKKLGVRAIDQSGSTERVLDSGCLDSPLASREPGRATDPGADPSVPPAGSGITVSGAPGARTILLPAVPFQPVCLFVVLFGAAFAGFALLALSAALGISSMKVSGSRVGLGVIASLFTLIGSAIAALPFLAASAREEVREAADDLVFSTRLGGRALGVKRIARRDIEEIDLRIDASPHQEGGTRLAVNGVGIGMAAAGGGGPWKDEVFVRSDRVIARLGRDLTPEAKHWLRGALQTLARA